MKIVMLRPSYLPEQSGGNHLAVNLIEDLSAHGFDVEVITPVSNNFSEDEIYTYEYPVYRIHSNIKGNSTIERLFRYIGTSFGMFFQLMKLKDIDIIFSHSMPPMLGPLCVLAGKIKNVPVVYWEQDIVSESIKSTAITQNKIISNIFYYLALLVEKISLKGSTKIITISEKFKEIRTNQGIDSSKIEVIYNWIDTDEIKPIPRNKNFLFDKYNLDRDKFYITYCGNLGVPQNVEIMVDAAEKLKSYRDIEFLIFGGGSREKKIKNYINNKNLTNIRLFPLEPLENAEEVYNVGNIGLVIAKSGTSNNGFPSKTWSILSAGQSIISCFDIDSELSRLINNNNIGLAVKPDSSEELVKAILELYFLEDQGQELGVKARTLVKNNYSRNIATNKIIKSINELLC